MKKIFEKDIKFVSCYPEFDLKKPQPSSRYIPEWYRKTDGVKNGNETIKKCIPFLDSLTSGYMIELSSDVSFNKEKRSFSTNSKIPIVSEHFLDQVDKFETPEGFSIYPYKWLNNWEIKTPKGYSTLFLHPLNSPFLPFYSFSGIVDTDTHPLIINFPFILRDDFSGIIKAGTPIIQLIPFKRDDWKSTIIDDKPYKNPPKEWEVLNAPFSWYKRNFWHKKSFR